MFYECGTDIKIFLHKHFPHLSMRNGNMWYKSRALLLTELQKRTKHVTSSCSKTPVGKRKSLLPTHCVILSLFPCHSRCECLPGYVGQHCEQDYNDCLENKCQHGAECVDAVNGYTCVCKEAFRWESWKQIRHKHSERLEGQTGRGYRWHFIIRDLTVSTYCVHLCVCARVCAADAAPCG